MSLIWHIAKKDIRRMALPVAQWLTFMLAAAVWLRTSWAPISGNDISGWGWPEIVRSFSLVVTIVEMALAYIFAGAVVLEDPLVGPKTFWMVRPIARVRLLTAKLVSIAVLLIIAPAVMMTAFGLGIGASGSDAFAGACEFVRTEGIVILIGITVASVSRSMTEFLFQAPIAAGVWSLGLWAMTFIHRPHGFMLDAHPYPVMKQLLPLIVVCVLLSRFAFRPAVLAWMCFGLCIGACALARIIHPWESDFDLGPVSQYESTPVIRTAVRGDLRTAYPYTDFVWFEVIGAAERTSKGAFHVPLGTFLEVASPSGNFAYTPNLEYLQLARTLAEDPSAAQLEWRLGVSLRRTYTRNFEGVRRVYSPCADVRAVGEVPMRIGAAIVYGPIQTRILAIDVAPDGSRVLLLEQHDFPRITRHYRPNARDVYVAIDRQTRRSVVLESQEIGDAEFTSQVVSLFRLTVSRSAFTDDAQLDRVTIVQIRYRGDHLLLAERFQAE